jgi:hypothetical protein
MMPYPEPIEGTRGIIESALKLYDQRFKGQNKSFWSHKVPAIEKLRRFVVELQDYKSEDYESREASIRSAIKTIIKNDKNYPNGDESHVQCEQIIDYFLFNGEIYKEKLDDPNRDLLKLMMYQNLLHYGNVDYLNLMLHTVPEYKHTFNQYFIFAIANACIESSLFVLKHLKDSVDLTIQEINEINPLLNNALMLAIAKGRQHTQVGGNSRITMSPLIDDLLAHPSAARAVNLKDSLNMTALHLAVLQGDIESVRILIKLGADFAIRNYEGLTAFDYLNVTYKVAGEHLEGYSSGCAPRKTHLELTANHKMSPCKAYTMPNQEVWEATKAEISKLLSSNPEEKYPPNLS